MWTGHNAFYNRGYYLTKGKGRTVLTEALCSLVVTGHAVRDNDLRRAQSRRHGAFVGLN